MNREQQAGSECGVSHPDGYPRCDMKRGHEGSHMGSDRGLIYEWDATPPATPEPRCPTCDDTTRCGDPFHDAPPAASGDVERLIAHLWDRFALLTDCTPLDEKSATVLHARIDELQKAIAVAGDRPTPGGTK